MRKITLFFALAILIVLPFMLRAQQNELQKKITITESVMSGYELLEEITKQTEYKFSYSESVIEIPLKVELSIDKGSIENFLDQIFKVQLVEYVIEDKTVFIKRSAIKRPRSLQKSIVLKGKIVDKKTKKAIPLANISICNHSVGLASNEFGEFIFKIPNKFTNGDLCVNVIGYNYFNREISLFDENVYHIIELEPKIYSIEEVSIHEKASRKFTNPKDIVKLAIDNIDKNYPKEPFILQGYYREYLRHKSNNYLNMLEAAIIVNDNGFNSNFFPYNAQMLQKRYNNDLIIVNEFRTKYDDENSKSKFLKYLPNHYIPSFGGNELSILFAHDAIRRQNELTFAFINKFNEDFTRNHKFKLDSIIFTDNIPIYCLSFFPSSNRNNIEVAKKLKNPELTIKYKEGKQIEYKYNSNIEGKIMIRSNNWAIERLEYCSYFTKSKKKKIYKVIIDYNSVNGKMYLNHLVFSNYFKINIHPQRTDNLDIPKNEQPLIINEILVENDALILKCNKNLRKWSVSKKDFEFNGFVLKRDSIISDTILLSKNPDKVSILNSNNIKLSVKNIHYLLSYFGEPEIKISNSDTIEYGKAIVRNNEIVMGDIILSINRIVDVSGNRLNKLYSMEMYQCREFFVNDIPRRSNPAYSRVILNEIPLYKQTTRVLSNFWDSFNFPVSIPLLDN